MTEALRAEWIKLRTLTSTAWLLIGAVAVTVGVSAAIAADTHQSSGGSGQDPTKLALTGIDLGQAVVAVLAVLAISEEYGTGMIRATLAAIPHRLTVLGAKAANLVVLTLAASVPAVAGCLLAGRLMLALDGFGQAHGYALVSIAHPATLRAASGSVIYLSLIALLASASPPPSATRPSPSASCWPCSTFLCCSPRPSVTRSGATSSKSPP